MPNPPMVVGIAGAGLMGHGIAQVFMLSGATVRIWDPDDTVLQSVPGRIREHLSLLGINADVDIGLASSLSAAVAEADLIVEAAPEALPIKRELIRQFDQMAPSAVVASNTSALSISEISEGSAWPGRVLGAHWWNPPYVIPVVEVVPGEQTSQCTVTSVVRWLRAAGKVPVALNRDAPGFIGNRMQFALWREAMAIVEEGICDAATVDVVVRGTFGLRLAAMGPLENADFIGLDLTSSIMDYLLPKLSRAQETPQFVREARGRGDKGAESGRGIFEWPGGSREEAERRLLGHLVRLLSEGDSKINLDLGIRKRTIASPAPQQIRTRGVESGTLREESRY